MVGGTEHDGDDRLPVRRAPTGDEMVDALADMRSTLVPDAKMTEARWKNVIDIYRELGIITAPIPPTDGTIWTNKYLVDIPKS